MINKNLLNLGQSVIILFGLSLSLNALAKHDKKGSGKNSDSSNYEEFNDELDVIAEDELVLKKQIYSLGVRYFNKDKNSLEPKVELGESESESSSNKVNAILNGMWLFQWSDTFPDNRLSLMAMPLTAISGMGVGWQSRLSVLQKMSDKSTISYNLSYMALGTQFTNYSISSTYALANTDYDLVYNRGSMLSNGITGMGNSIYTQQSYKLEIFDSSLTPSLKEQWIKVGTNNASYTLAQILSWQKQFAPVFWKIKHTVQIQEQFTYDFSSFAYHQMQFFISERLRFPIAESINSSLLFKLQYARDSHLKEWGLTPSIFALISGNI